MPKPAKYNDKTPVSEIMKAYEQVEVCSQSFLWSDKYLGKSFGDMAEGCKDKDFDPSWGVWFLHKFGEETDVSIRQKIIAAIKDAMMAFQVYLSFVWLTDEEDKLLEEKFKGKLPTAEEELKNGIVTRAK